MALFPEKIDTIQAFWLANKSASINFSEQNLYWAGYELEIKKGKKQNDERSDSKNEPIKSYLPIYIDVPSKERLF